MLDYKFHRLTKDPRGRLSGIVRVYDGEIATENELVRGEMQPVTRYRRSKLLGEHVFSFGADNPSLNRASVKEFLRNNYALKSIPDSYVPK